MSTASPHLPPKTAASSPSSPQSELDFRPKTGQSVRVASWEDIMPTLDENGCYDGMPFMPEMQQFCGRTFPVLRWANSVCIFGDKIQFRKLDNVVVLDMPRCCGTAHDNCQMACTYFWQTRWLEPNISATTETHTPPQLVSLLTNNTRDDGTFRCQATQLGAVSAEQGSLAKRISDEYNLNRLNVSHFASDFCSTLLAKATRTQGGLSGPCEKQTPVQNLNLQVGDRVTVRSKDSIRATLNADGKNRGLWFDPAMLPYCGKTMQVTRRVEQFINESTGKMLRPSVPSIVLDEEHCSGRGRHYCSRLLHFFWREIWLERETC